MAKFGMAVRGPGSINPPTLDLIPIGPKVTRPRPKFVTPGQHWDYDEVPSDESPPDELIDYLPEAEEIIRELPDAAQEAFREDAFNLEDPTDSALVDLALRYKAEVITEKLRGWVPEKLPTPEPPSESVYSDVLDSLLRRQARGYAVTRHELKTLWRLAPQEQR